MMQDTPPAGYSKLPDGVRCRCVKLWQGEDGFYCCKPRASEMTDKQTPPDWVFLEAAKRSGRTGSIEYLRRYYAFSTQADFRALCDMIERYEQPPVDRKVLCAREAMAGQTIMLDDQGYPLAIDVLNSCIRAIELWENGYGA